LYQDHAIVIYGRRKNEHNPLGHPASLKYRKKTRF